MGGGTCDSQRPCLHSLWNSKGSVTELAHYEKKYHLIPQNCPKCSPQHQIRDCSGMKLPEISPQPRFNAFVTAGHADILDMSILDQRVKNLTLLQ